MGGHKNYDRQTNRLTKIQKVNTEAPLIAGTDKIYKARRMQREEEGMNRKEIFASAHSNLYLFLLCSSSIVLDLNLFD